MSDEMIVSFPGGKRVDASFDGFRVETDQSEKNGGAGAAPEPFELFLALPYIVTIIALAIAGRNAAYPGAYLKPYRREWVARPVSIITRDNAGASAVLATRMHMWAMLLVLAGSCEVPILHHLAR